MPACGKSCEPLTSFRAVTYVLPTYMRSTSSRDSSDFLNEGLLVRKILEVDKVLDAVSFEHLALFFARVDRDDSQADREGVLRSEMPKSATCPRDHDGIAGLGVSLRIGKDARQADRLCEGWRKSGLASLIARQAVTPAHRTVLAIQSAPPEAGSGTGQGAAYGVPQCRVRDLLEWELRSERPRWRTAGTCHRRRTQTLSAPRRAPRSRRDSLRKSRGKPSRAI